MNVKRILSSGFCSSYGEKRNLNVLAADRSPPPRKFSDGTVYHNGKGAVLQGVIPEKRGRKNHIFSKTYSKNVIFSKKSIKKFQSK